MVAQYNEQLQIDGVIQQSLVDIKTITMKRHKPIAELFEDEFGEAQ